MNDGLIIADGIGAGLRTYSQMQSIDANKQAMGLRDSQARMQADQHQAQMRESAQREKINNARMRQIDQEDQQRAMSLLARRLYAIDSGGDASPEEIEQYSAITGGGRLTDPKYIASQEVGDALAIYPRVLSGEVDKNSPEAIKAYNALINVQRGATDGRKVTINRVVPSRDGQGVHFGLHVVNQDGTENQNGVLTQNRSADPGDPVASVSFDELNDIYGAATNLRAMVTNPKMRQALYREYGLTGQKVSAIDQSTINANNARANYWNSKASAAGGGSGGSAGKLPAKAQMVNFYKGMGYGDDDAIAMANDSASSPEKFVTSYSKMLLETSKDSNGEATISPEQAFEKSMEVYNNNFRRKPGAGKEAPKKAPELNIPGMNNQKPPAVRPPLKAPVQAPAAAIEFLQANPDQAENFKAKYGYLPQGF